MTLTEFKNINPGQGTISILKDGDDVVGMTIHQTGCSLTSYVSSISQLTGMTIQLGGDIAVGVNSVTNYGTYYFLDVTPFTFTETITPEACVDITLEPFLEATNINFRNSVFYPVFNNVPESLYLPATEAAKLYKGKIEVRRGKNIQDVDRKKDAIIPTNINQLLIGAANLAEFPESNYSSLSNTSGRYIGSKTSTADYGTNPSLALQPFQGQLYRTEIDSMYICSQSTSDRVITQYGFDSEFNDKPSTALLPTGSIEAGNRLGYISGSVSPATITETQTVILARVFNREISKIKVGKLLYITDNTNFDYTEITKVENLGYADPDETFFRFTLKRGADGNSKALTGNVSAIPAYTLNIKLVDSDTVYEFSGNKPITVSDKKIYIEETQEIYKIGPKGKILYRVESCSI